VPQRGHKQILGFGPVRNPWKANQQGAGLGCYPKWSYGHGVRFLRLPQLPHRLGGFRALVS